MNRFWLKKISPKSIVALCVTFAIVGIFVLLSPTTSFAQESSFNPEFFPWETSTIDDAPQPAPGVTTQQDTTKPPAAKAACALDWITIFNIGTLSGCVMSIMGNFILALSALVVGIAGVVLDGAMWMTVDMKNIVEGTKIVDTGWAIFRDLANMMFIFVLLYIAIATILNIVDTKKLLVNIIITALLVNFSLFITKAVVDVSNVVAIAFHNRIQSVAIGQPTLPGVFPDAFQRGPAMSLFNSLKIQTLYNFNTSGELTSGNGLDDYIFSQGGNLAASVIEPVKMLSTAILGSIVMLFFALMMLIGAVLLIIRIVVLMFLMMISPLAFIARILPSMEGSWNKWWHSLINHAIFAPAYFALLYIVLQSAGGLSSVSHVYVGSLSSALSGVTASFGVILNYIFMMIMIAGTLFVAKSLGIHGANTAQKWADSASGAARSFVGKHTLGRAARRFEEYAATSPFWSGKGPGRGIVSKTIGLGAVKARELITQPASSAKWGGKESAYDMKKREKVRASGEQEAVRLQELLTEAKKGKDADQKKLEDLSLRLAPQTLANLDMKYIRALPVGMLPDTHWQAIMASDKVQKDKDDLSLLRLKPAEVVREKIQAETRATILLQQHPELAETYLNGGGLKLFLKKEAADKKVAEGKVLTPDEIVTPEEKAVVDLMKKSGVSWSQEQQTKWKPAFEFVRAKSPKELGQLNRVSPEAINELAQVMNWGPQIQPLRKSDDLTFEQRNGQDGEQLRDFKDKALLDALDMIYGIKLYKEEGGKIAPKSLKERYKERQRLSRVFWKARQYGTASIEDPDHRMHAKYSEEEKKAWEQLTGEGLGGEERVKREKEREIGQQLFKAHHQGRSDSELTLGRTYMRNDPINFASMGSGSVPFLLDRDNDKKEEQGGQLLTSLAEDQLTEENKLLAAKVFWDRDADKYLKNWGEIAKRNYGTDAEGNIANPIIRKILEWKKQGNKGKEKFMEYVKTIEHEKFYPGSKEKANTDWGTILRGEDEKETRPDDKPKDDDDGSRKKPRKEKKKPVDPPPGTRYYPASHGIGDADFDTYMVGGDEWDNQTVDMFKAILAQQKGTATDAQKKQIYATLEHEFKRNSEEFKKAWVEPAQEWAATQAKAVPPTPASTQTPPPAPNYQYTEPQARVRSEEERDVIDAKEEIEGLKAQLRTLQAQETPNHDSSEQLHQSIENLEKTLKDANKRLAGSMEKYAETNVETAKKLVDELSRKRDSMVNDPYLKDPASVKEREEKIKQVDEKLAQATERVNRATQYTTEQKPPQREKIIPSQQSGEKINPSTPAPKSGSVWDILRKKK